MLVVVVCWARHRHELCKRLLAPACKGEDPFWRAKQCTWNHVVVMNSCNAWCAPSMWKKVKVARLSIGRPVKPTDHRQCNNQHLANKKRLVCINWFHHGAHKPPHSGPFLFWQATNFVPTELQRKHLHLFLIVTFVYGPLYICKGSAGLYALGAGLRSEPLCSLHLNFMA
jgi:hypothetical protein